MTSTLTFLGAAGTVTGSKTIVDTPGGRILVDCGLFQGRKRLRLQNWDPFPVDPKSIDAIVLPDSGHLQEEDAAYANRRGFSKHSPALPLYTEEDARRALNQFKSVGFDKTKSVIDGVDVTWHRAGHILGAAFLDIHIKSSNKHLIFSGDLGRSTHPLLRPPAPIGQADVVVVESTYGNRLHSTDDADAVIADVVNRAAKHGGVVVVPSFAVDRTEVVLWHLDRLIASGQVPSIPVFVDSPMASRALDVYRSEALGKSPEFRSEVSGKELFRSLHLTETRQFEESRTLRSRRGPMIIVSASGMATGGRVLHHLSDRLGNYRNAVLIVGFQAPGSRGQALLDGVSSLKMFGSEYAVRAKVVSVELSAHADQADLVDWVDTADSAPKAVYVNHGEPAGSEALAELLRSSRALEASVAVEGEEMVL